MIEELDDLLYHKAIEIMTSEKKNNLRQFELEEDEWTIAEQLSDILQVRVCVL